MAANRGEEDSMVAMLVAKTPWSTLVNLHEEGTDMDNVTMQQKPMKMTTQHNDED
jgi:hypothetical protein